MYANGTLAFFAERAPRALHAIIGACAGRCRRAIFASLTRLARREKAIFWSTILEFSTGACQAHTIRRGRGPVFVVTGVATGPWGRHCCTGLIAGRTIKARQAHAGTGLILVCPNWTRLAPANGGSAGCVIIERDLIMKLACGTLIHGAKLTVAALYMAHLKWTVVIVSPTFLCATAT